ncbi:hypothetical protein M2140_001871 [Clostridiales Family XIII bacterium PM5-7]
MPEKDRIVFEIKRHLGVLNNQKGGWTKELNLISWNGQKPKYDVRDWDVDHTRMGKGLTLSVYEMRKLVDYYLSDNNRQVVDTAKQEELERRERWASSKRPESVKGASTQGEAEEDLQAEATTLDVADQLTPEDAEAQDAMPLDGNVIPIELDAAEPDNTPF